MIQKSLWALTIVLLALIGSVAALTIHGDIGGEAAVGFFTGLVGFLSGAGAHAAGARTKDTSSPSDG